PGLFAYLQQTFAYVTPPLVAAFVMAMWNRHIGARSALYGTVSGHAISLLWFIGSQAGWLTLHFTIVAGVLFALSCLAMAAWQIRFGEAPEPDRLAAIRQDASWRVSLPLRVGMAVCAVITLALVLSFW
ncbi:MAG TPA: hypothetical protein VLF15_01635, partial [Pseudoxanthomonas sp.]|nr:hypothetical protein [Pseudoxanthomonas sp.]